MHRGLSLLLVCVAVAVVVVGVRELREASRVGSDDAVTLLIAHNPRLARDGAAVLDAYTSVLKEEGLPWRLVDQLHLVDLDPAALAVRCPALIFPEIVTATGLTPLTHWLRAYMHAGGHLLLVHDVGTRDEDASLRTNRGLRDLLDLAVEPDDPSGRARFGQGGVRFLRAEHAAAFGVPPGKLSHGLQLTGYGFGMLRYPFALAPLAGDRDPRIEVLAWGENELGLGGPVILTRPFGPGGLLYVGLPLGHLKGQADDLPLRLTLRYLTGRRAPMPRVVPAPRGVGSLVLSWHVDANADHAALPAMAAGGFLDPELPASWHITAGPDNDRPGDGLGFDACGRGRELLDRLPASSELGSHGGWAHNHFARLAATGQMPDALMRALVLQNRDCLAAVAGRPLREYSSPAGVHPQPMLTGIIADLGFTSYYYTGDGGSAPNRTFFAGRRVEPPLIAFPVLPLRENASLGEIVRDPAVSPAELAAWLDAAARYCADQRTTRLVYAHPYDLFTGPGEAEYRAVWLAWQGELRAMQAAGRLQVRTMGVLAEFLDRCWRTRATFRRSDLGLQVSLRNPAGLHDIAVLIPAAGLAAPADARVSVREDADWYHLTVEVTDHALDLLLPAR